MDCVTSVCTSHLASKWCNVFCFAHFLPIMKLMMRLLSTYCNDNNKWPINHA